jgi:hypothetical protein
VPKVKIGKTNSGESWCVRQKLPGLPAVEYRGGRLDLLLLAEVRLGCPKYKLEDEFLKSRSVLRTDN